MHKQKGLSLIELMIAITLGLVLMGGVIQMFLSTRQVFSTQQALSRIQETGRLAMEFVARDIRMAGYMGCMTRSNGAEITNTLNNADSFDTNFAVAIQGYTAPVATNLIPAAVFGQTVPVTGSDVVVLRSASSNGVAVVDDNTSARVFVSQTGVEVGGCGKTDRISGLCDNDIVVIADCSKAKVFQATTVVENSGTVNLVHSATGTPGNAISSWGGSSGAESDRFTPGSEVMTATSTTYFIAVPPDSETGMPSLYQRSSQTAINMELLEGVERMTIRYGVDTDPTEDFIPNVYRSAAEVTAAGNWDRVLSVRIHLLVASLEQNVLADPQGYFFNEEEIKADEPAVADRRLRMVFTNTIGIRSRLP